MQIPQAMACRIGVVSLVCSAEDRSRATMGQSTPLQRPQDRAPPARRIAGQARSHICCNVPWPVGSVLSALFVRPKIAVGPSWASRHPCSALRIERRPRGASPARPAPTTVATHHGLWGLGWRYSITSVNTTSNGNSTAHDHAMYPKKLGIFTPRCSAIALTMKFGALPM